MSGGEYWWAATWLCPAIRPGPAVLSIIKTGWETSGNMADYRDSLVHSYLSRNVQAWLSLVESFKVLKYFHGVAMRALLCHKEPAQGTHNAPIALGGILCLSLVLYGIRIGGFHAQKGSTIGALR